MRIKCIFLFIEKLWNSSFIPNADVLMPFRYHFLMTNGPGNDILHHHFSADEFYLLPILFVAAILHMSLLFMSIWSAVVLKSRQLLHATYKLFLTLIFLHVSILYLLAPGYFTLIVYTRLAILDNRHHVSMYALLNVRPRRNWVG